MGSLQFFNYLESITDWLSVNELLGGMIPIVGNHRLVHRKPLLVPEPAAGGLVEVVEQGTNLNI